jgi:hypothetical protein
LILNFRNAATLSAVAAKNVMELSANIQKMGVEKAMRPLVTAMSSTADLFYSASDQTKALLFQAASYVGRVGDLMAGTVLKTKGGMKDMAAGMEKVLKNFGVESAEAIDTLSDGAKMKLNLQLKAAFGIELGEFQQSLKSLKESSKSVGEKLDDINKKQQANLTTEEKIALQEEARRLKTSKSLEIMTALDEAAKGAKDMNSALAQFGKRKGEFEGDLKSMGKSWSSNAEAARGAINEALKGVNESLKASGKAELKIDSSEIDKAMKDPQAFRELSAKLSKAEQEAATAQKAALDPMSKIEQGVLELNDTMRDFSSKFLSGYMNLTGVLGLLVPALGLLAASTAISAKAFTSDVMQGAKANPLTGEREGVVGTLLEKIGVIPKHHKKLESEQAAKSGGEDKFTPGSPTPTAPAVPASPTDALKAAGAANATVKTHDDSMLSVLQEALAVLRSIEKCVCSVDPKEDKALKNELTNNKLAKEANEAQIAGTESDMQHAEKAAGKAAEGEKKKGGGDSGAAEPAEPGLEGLIKKLQKDGPNAAKLAGILAVAAVGIIVLGTVLMKLCSMLLSAINLDIGTVLKTAAVIAAVAGAAAALGMAVFMSKEPLEKLSEMGVKPSDFKKMGQGALVLLVLGPALVLLATAILSLVRLIGWAAQMDWSVAIKLAADMAAIIGAAGGLAKAVEESQPHIEKMSGVDFKKIESELWKVSKGLIRILGPVALFAGALFLFGKVVVDAMKLTPGRMIQIAASFIALTAGMGGIAYAINQATPHIETLGKASSQMTSMQGTLWKAVGAFALISLPLMAFATALALFGWVVIDGLGLSPVRMFEVAATWLILAAAVGSIGYALIYSIPSWALMASAVSDGGATISTMMWTAAYAFALISLPVMAFGAAMALFGWVVIDGLGLDPARMFAIAATWLILAAGVGGIAYALTLGMPGWLSLAAITPLIWSAYGIIWAAVGAFILVTAPIVAFAAALALFGIIVIDEFKLTPGRMFQIAATWVILAAGVAGIAYAITLGVPGWLSLGAIAPLLWSAYGMIWAAVGAFALVTAPIIAFAGILAAFGDLVIDEFKLTPGRMFQIAATWLVLAVGIGAIGYALTFSVPAWVTLGASLWALLMVYGLIWAAVAAFALVTAPIVAFAAILATFGELVIDDLGLTPGRMFQIAATWAILALGVGAIAYGLTLSMPGFTLLGGMYMVALALYGLIWLGVAAFGLLTLPVLALASIIAGFGEAVIDDLGLTSARMDEIGKTFTDLAFTIGELSWVMLGANASLASLGLLYVGVWMMSFFTGLGVKAFNILSTPLLALASTIAGFGESVIDDLGLSSGRMQEISDSFITLTNTIGKLSMTMLAANASLSLLGLLSVFAFWAMGFVWLGVSAFRTLAEPLVALAGTIADFGNSIDIGDLQNAANACQEIAKSILALPPVFDALMNGLYPLTQGGWFFGKSVLQKVLEMRLTFAAAFWAITSWLKWGIIAPIMIYFPDESLLTSAAQQAQSMASVISSLPPIFDAMMNGLLPLMKGGWFFGKSPIKKILGMREEFKLAWWAIAEFLSQGVVAPILAWFDDPGALDQAAKQATSMAALIQTIPPIITTINDAIVPLMKPKLWGMAPSKMQKALEVTKGDFKENFKAILKFIAEGIVDPIFDPAINLNPTDIGIAAKAMQGLAGLLPAIPTVIEAMNGPLAKLMRPGLFGGQSKMGKAFAVAETTFKENLKSILKFIAEGIVDPIFDPAINLNPTDLGIVAKSIKALAELLPAIPTVIEAMNGPLARLMRPGLFGGKSKMGKALALTEGTFKENLKSIMKFIAEGIIDPIFDPAINLNPRDLEIVAKSMKALAELLPAIPTVIETLNGPLARLMTPSLWSGQSKMDKSLAIVGSQFANNLRSIFLFIGTGIIDPVFEANLNPRDIQFAADAMKNTAGLLPAVAQFVSRLGWQVQAIMGSTDMQMKMANITQFAAWFANVSKLLTDGMIVPIQTMFPPPEEVQAATDRLEGMSQVVAKIPRFMEQLYENANKTNEIKSWKEGAVTTMSGWFSNVARMLKVGILDPISLWPENSEIQEAVDKLTALDELFRAMANAMQGVAQAAEQMQSVDVNASISGFNAPDTGFVDSINTAYNDIMAKQAGVMNVGAFDPKILNDAGAAATDQMSANATSLQGTLSELLNPKALSDIFANVNGNMSVGADAGGFSSMISSFVEGANSQMGMGDSNALVDAISKQTPQITAMQSAIRQVENYTTDLSDLFERASNVVKDIQKTTEYMAMFSDLDFYEKMISEKVGASKEFVPTVQRIAENIGRGFNFDGGKDMIATIASQSSKIEEMKTGLAATEEYTRKLSEIFAMANNTIQQIRTTTQNLDALANIREVEANIVSRISSGNSFMTEVMKTVEAVATNFGSNEELNRSITTVQEAIKRSGDTSKAMTDALTFIETIRKLQTTVMQVGQSAATAGGNATASGGQGGTGGSATATGGQGGNAIATGGQGGAGGNGGIETIAQTMSQTLSEIKNYAMISADSLRLMVTEATTKGSLYVADHAMVKTTEGTQETIVKGDNKLKEATMSATERTATALEAGNMTLAETINSGQQNMMASIETANSTLSNSIMQSSGLLNNANSQVGGSSLTSMNSANGIVGANIGSNSSSQEWTNLLSDAEISSAVNSALGNSAVTNVGNIIGGSQGIANSQNMMSQAMSSANSQTGITTLGGGVPGAGMPTSVSGGVSLVTPEPIQTAAHTAATSQSIQSQIMQERATSIAPSATPGQTQDNSALQGIMQDGNVTAEGILSVLQAMYNMMKPKSGQGGGPGGNTGTNVTNNPPASYFRAPCGDFQSSNGANNMARIR